MFRSLSRLLLTFVASHHAYGSYLSSEGNGFRDESSPPCQKYIILTTPRSGSTWISNLFDLQDGVVCGGSEFDVSSTLIRKPELMVRYSSLSEEEEEELSWVKYQEHLTAAFNHSIEANEVCNSSSSVGGLTSSFHAGASGFKLMYNQIPRKFIWSGQFMDYLVRNDIAVVQLVREAKILRLASLKRMFYLGREPHTINESAVQNFRTKVTPVPWDEFTIEKIHHDELKDEQWENRLKEGKVRYYRLKYENMLSKEGLQDELKEVFEVLNLEHSKDKEFNYKSLLLQLQKPTCRGRVERYKEFLQRIPETKTLAACIMLDDLYGDYYEESSG